VAKGCSDRESELLYHLYPNASPKWKSTAVFQRRAPDNKPSSHLVLKTALRPALLFQSPKCIYAQNYNYSFSSVWGIHMVRSEDSAKAVILTVEY